MVKQKIGFIGLGAMGLPMARNILEAGFELCIAKHKNPLPIESLKKAGANVYANAEEVVAHSDVVISILPTDKEVEAVLLSDNVINAFQDNAILVEMTSGSPDKIKKLAEIYQSRQIRILDAPVSGGTIGAEQGTLTVMVGGKADLLEEVRDVIHAMARHVYLVGDVGAGNAIKAINQMLAGIHMIASSEAISLAKELNVDMAMIKEVIGNSSGASWMLLNKTDAIVKEDFNPGFKLDLMKKDIQIAVDEGKSSVLPIASLALQLYKAAQQESGQLDFAAISKSIIR
ncbi:NAD(P)-dependent oxidoreductase [Gracilibacillus alcaliphilus]|uniref:NAD(P)-dependent oxidoreductase n=1 Tax=Gracilibacillus alcaliphilus TaxID=1401441 RepID=UPI00195BA06E|nr:NAD(P)-dependent oxidoreductase [Gracilibacillus alcaliphilus]MBM7677285.1 3-hydroxyisobutyrate dehydrogenase-like beta-hydroxyacid dehydrogenase [Gracilibacillus alcaliphilus]